MLSFYDGVNFQALKEDANADFEELTQTCDLTLQQLERIVDYKTFLPIIGALIGVILWGQCYMLFSVSVPDRTPAFFGVILLFSIIGLIICRAWELLGEIKHLSMVKKYSGRIKGMKEKIDQWQCIMKNESDQFIAAAEEGWMIALTPDESIYEQIDKLQSDINRIKRFEKKFFVTAEAILAFGISEAITIIGSTACYDWIIEKVCNIFYNVMGLMVPSNAVYKILVVASILAMIAEGIVLFESFFEFSLRVNNLTLFLTLVGPLLFALIVVIIALIPVIVIIALLVLLIKKKKG